MFRATFFVALIPALVFCVSVSAQEGVLIGMPDPAVIQADNGSFYIFATGRGLPIYHSTDLVNWEKVGTVPVRCFIEPNKDSFIGRNRTGVVIRGKKLCW